MNLDFDRDVYKEYEKWFTVSPNDILFVKGSRQVGKTYSIKKFCKKNFKNVYYLNLTAGEGLDLVKYCKISSDMVDNIYKCFPKFIDNENSVIIIDEIQLDPNVYNGAIDLKSKMKCRVVLSGSYLGLIDVDNKFFKYIGEFFEVSVKPLSFSEFTKIFGMHDLFISLDLFGKSSKEDYLKIKKLFLLYTMLGGMPKAVSRFLDFGSYGFLKELNTLKTTFIREAFYYNSGVYKYDVIETFLKYLRVFIATQRNGTNVNISSELKKISVKDDKLNLSKKDVSSLYGWFLQSELIRSIPKYTDCDLNKFTPNQKIFFTDIGVARFMLDNLSKDSSVLSGYLYENYIFNTLDRLNYSNLGFATFSGFQGELDFIIDVKFHNGLFGIEVKKGNDQGKSALRALKEKKIDKLVYFKGDTFGGIDGDKITVPIYLAERFNFEDFCLDSDESMNEFKIFDKMIEDGKFIREEE